MLEGLGSILDDEEIITGSLVRERIEEWLKENCDIIGTYKIFQKDNTNYVDVIGSIYINENIDRFPTELFCFNRVTNFFDCSYCKKLKSLKGGPRVVQMSFNCSGCSSLTTLEGSPKEVGRFFTCNNCSSLNNLEGITQKIGVRIDCSYCNNLINFKGCPEKLDILTCVMCNSLTSLEGAPERINIYFDCSGCTNLESLGEDLKSIGGDFICKNCDKLFKKYKRADIDKLIKIGRGVYNI